MSELDDILAEANDVFFETFAERPRGSPTSVIYRPVNGTARPIEAIIERYPPEEVQKNHAGTAWSLIISVRNDPIRGIASSTFDAGADRIDVPLVYGGPLINRGFVQEKYRVDGAMLTLKVM